MLKQNDVTHKRVLGGLCRNRPTAALHADVIEIRPLISEKHVSDKWAGVSFHVSVSTVDCISLL